MNDINGLAAEIENYVPLGFTEHDPYADIPEAARAIGDVVRASDWLADHVATAVAAERERIAAALEDEARHPLISNGVTEFTKGARMTFLSAARITRTQGDPA